MNPGGIEKFMDKMGFTILSYIPDKYGNEQIQIKGLQTNKKMKKALTEYNRYFNHY